MEPLERGTWSGVVLRRVDGEDLQETSGSVRLGGRPIEPGTRFQAGSISKTILAITVLRLVEDGVLDLDGPIRSWVPAIPADKRRLTMHQLLTHTAGLGHWADLGDIDVADPPTGPDLLRLVLETPAPHPTGDFFYSAFGYLLASAVIEHATGRRYAEAAQEAVFVPARMGSTTSGVFPIEDADCAWGQHDGEPLVTSPTPTSIPGTGDLWTTAADLIRLGEALRSSRLLQPEHVSAMTDVQVEFPTAAIVDERIVSSGYGYGTWVGSVSGERAAIHPGDNIGYRSLLLRFLDRQEDVAVLTNDDGPPLAAPLDIALGGSDGSR